MKNNNQEKNNIYKIFNHYSEYDDSEKEFSENIKSSLERFKENEERKEKEETITNTSNNKKCVVEVEKKSRPFWVELIINVIVIIFLFFIIRNFVFVPFSIEGSSMEGTLHDGEFIYVDKATPYFRSYKRGDIVVFIPPYKKIVKEKFLLCQYHKIKNILFQEKKENPCMAQASFIKRIIGVDGDVIEIKGGHVFLTPKGGEKQEISQDFLLENNKNKTCIPAFDCQNKKNKKGKIFPPVPKGKYFVLGDNRRNSSDSRELSWNTPFVDEKDIIGIARAVFLSPPLIREQGLIGTIKNIFKSFSHSRILHQQKIIEK